MNNRIISISFLWMLVGIGLVSCSSSNSVGDDGDTIIIKTDSLQKYPKQGEIKVMSFNIRLETKEENAVHNWAYRKIACVDMIKDQKPTVIGLQEAIYTSQWAYLKEQLSEDYGGFGVGRDDGDTKGECMGILYRKNDVEKINGGTFWLSDEPDIPSKGWSGSYYRSATWGIFRLKVTGKYFVYVNSHLEVSSSSIRAKEMQLIISKFAEYNPNGYIQFFTADCNTSSSDTIFNDFKKTMKSARENAHTTDYSNTFNGWGDSTGLIDDVFIVIHVALSSFMSLLRV